jgi:hypothetical protein
LPLPALSLLSLLLPLMTFSTPLRIVELMVRAGRSGVLAAYLQGSAHMQKNHTLRLQMLQCRRHAHKLVQRMFVQS